MRKLFIAAMMFTLFASNVMTDVTRHIPATWPETADSAKIFIFSIDASTVVDSSAGAARTSTVSYDTVITLSLEDSSYNVVVKIWYPGAPGDGGWIFTFSKDTVSTNANMVAISGDATAADNLETMLDGTGGQTFSLGKLNISGTDGTASVNIVNSGAGKGLLVQATGADAVLFDAAGGSNAGLAISGNAAGAGVNVTAGATGQGVLISGGGTSGDAVQLSVTSGVHLNSDIDSNAYDEGYWHKTANRADSGAAAGGGLDTLSTAFQLRLVSLIADTNWLSLLEARDGVAGSFGDSSGGWGATAAGALTGGNFTAALGTVDTLSGAAADTLVPFINVDFFNLAGSFLGRLQSDVNGYIALGIDSGRYLVRASNVFNANYIFPTHAGGFDTIHIFADGDTIPSSLAHADSIAVDSAITGYNFVIGVPTGDSVCRVYGFIRDAAQDGIKGVTVEASLRQGGAWDTVANVFITSDVIPTKTDATGYWFLDLSRSSSLDPGQDYIFSAYKRGTDYFTRIIRTVPDSTDHRLTVR